MSNLDELKASLDTVSRQISDLSVVLINLSEAIAEMQETESVPDSLESIGCPVCVINPLARCGITRVGQVICRTEKELLQITNFGITRVSILKERLASRGFHLRGIFRDKQ